MAKKSGKYPGNAPASGSTSMKSYDPKSTMGGGGGKAPAVTRMYSPPDKPKFPGKK